MNKKFLFLMVCFMRLLFANAQKTDLVFSSEKLPELKYVSKLKILKNGNTASIELNKDDQVVCNFYNTDKKKINSVQILLEQNFVAKMRAVMEINKDLMVMVVSYTKARTPTLYRFIFDGNTGQLKKQEAISKLPNLGATAAVAITAGNNPVSDFMIEKDPLSDYYAVISFDAFTEDMSKRMEIAHYSPTHEKINSAYYVSPDNAVKYTFAVSMYVNTDKSVIVNSYVANNAKPKPEESAAYYLSQLKKGSPTFTHKNIAQTKLYIIPDSKFIYNPVTQKLKIVFTVNKKEETDKRNELNNDLFYLNVQTLNPETMELGKPYIITKEIAKEYYKKKYGTDVKVPYLVVQNYIIDQKGDELLLLEETAVSIPPSPNISDKMQFCTSLRGITLTGMTPEGSEKYGKFVPYLHDHISPAVTFLYMNPTKGQFEYPRLGEFNGTYIGLISGKEANYMLINNIPANIDKADDVAPVYYTIKAVDPNLTTCLYTIGSNGEIQKEYLFGKPTEGNSKCALLHTADYNPEAGLYATQVIEKVNGEKKISIVWINLK